MKQLHYVLLPLILLSLIILSSCAAKRTATATVSEAFASDTTSLAVRTIRDSVILHVRDTTVLHFRDSLVITERIVEHYSPQDGTLVRRDIDRRTLQLRDSLATLSHRLDSLSAHRRDTLTHTTATVLEASASSSSSKDRTTPLSSRLFTFLVLFALAYLAVCAYQASSKK